VIKELLGGAASNDTRQVLLTGTNPFLQARAAADTVSLDDDSTATSMNSMTGGAYAAGRRAANREARRPVEQQQKMAGREAVKPGQGATLTQAIGTLPPQQGLAQIVGLALGAPEFQRR
jgi:hypothetical protein